MRRVLLIPLVLILCAAGCRTAAAEPARKRGIEEILLERVPAYVFIGGGSGVVISPDGYIITNAHVASGSARWRVRLGDGRYFVAGVVGSAPNTDLCLLKIENAENLPFMPLGDSDKLATGDVVVAIGNPFGLGNLDGQPTVTLGVVSAMHVDRPRAYDAIQTDAPINPGNSGGPILSMTGELVGISAQIEPRFGLRQNTGVGYAISANQVSRFLPALKSAGGRDISNADVPGMRMRGKLDEPAYIDNIEPNTPAQRAGLMKGDIIRSVGGMPIASLRELVSAFSRYPVGSELVLHVARGSEEFECVVVFDGEAQPYVGIMLRAGLSLAIDYIDPKSPAAMAGLRQGDVVVRIGDMPIRSRLSFYSGVRKLTPGMTVPFTVRRDGKELVFLVRVAEKQ